jgi:hypothetical protein
MANNLTMNPMFVDTAATLFPVGKPVYVKAIAWVSDQASGYDIAANDDLLVSDSAGNRVVGKRASFAGDGFEMYHFVEGYNTDGLVVTTIDGGVCYIYC